MPSEGATVETQQRPQVDAEAQSRLLDAATYAGPSLECDIVMKGGITSGVLYPLAVCELASTYTLRSVGGTSAGAIAAAAAAAAEHGRRSPASGTGFAGLAELPAWSSDGTNLRDLFRPTPATRPLHRLLMASISKPMSASGRLAKALRVVGALLTASANRFFWIPALMILPGLLVLWLLDWAPGGDLIRGIGIAALLAVLVGAAISVIRAPRPPRFIHCVPEAEQIRQTEKWTEGRARRALVLAGALAAILVAAILVAVIIAGARSGRAASGTALATLEIVLGLLVGAAIAALLGGGAAVADNMYGIVAGTTPAGDGLSDWLDTYIDRIAGIEGDHPLTFGQLWDGHAESGTARAVNLEMLTTCLTQGRPYRLPDSLGDSFFFDPAEFARIFPARVVRYLTDYEEDQRSTPGGQRDRELLVRHAATQGLVPLPPPRDLPVVVATRMSLSFPILISAVPLYAIDYTCKDPDETFRFERCWFSDGGITSNFPITFFDTLLPSRPTFGINLREFHPAHPKSRERECDNVWMPDRNDSGLLEWWTRTDDDRGLVSVVGFLGTIADTMQNWVDNRQIGVSGYRDRIVHVYHDDGEGGMNLDMPGDTLRTLAERGRCAGARLVEYYTTEAPGRVVSWNNHRWIRVRNTLSVMAEATQAIDAAYRNAGYRADLERATDDLPSYRWASNAQRDLAVDVLEGSPAGADPAARSRGLADIGADIRSAVDANDNMALSNGAPSPVPRFELRPRD